MAVRDILHGRTVQVDPIKPKLKLPGTKRLKLKCEGPLSICAFKFNLRRYNTGFYRLAECGRVYKAGAYTRPLFSST